MQQVRGAVGFLAALVHFTLMISAIDQYADVKECNLDVCRRVNCPPVDEPACWGEVHKVAGVCGCCDVCLEGRGSAWFL